MNPINYYVCTSALLLANSLDDDLFVCFDDAFPPTQIVNAKEFLGLHQFELIEC